jgi:hypothetical protein
LQCEFAKKKNLQCEPPMFVNPEEVLFPNWPVLGYNVQIEILEITDWRVPSDSSSGDSRGPYHGGLSRSWPKRYKRDNNGGSPAGSPAGEDFGST